MRITEDDCVVVLMMLICKIPLAIICFVAAWGAVWKSSCGIAVWVNWQEAVNLLGGCVL